MAWGARWPRRARKWPTLERRTVAFVGLGIRRPAATSARTEARADERELNNRATEPRQPARTVLVEEFLGSKSELPRNLARTRRTPRRVNNRVLNVTLPVYVQSALTRTLRDEIVVLRFWNRTFTMPTQATLRGTTAQ